MAIVIVGGGGFGTEVARYALDLHGPGAVRGYVARDAPGAHALAMAPHLGDDDTVRLGTDDELLLAVGDGRLRARLAALYADRGCRFATLLHPRAYVAPGAAIGPGTLVAPFGFVGCGASLGPHAVLNTYASVGHDARLGAACTLSPYAAVNGHVVLGDVVFLGSHALVTPGVTVGPYSKVVAGAVVKADAPAGSLLAGNPAKGRVMFTTADGVSL